MRLGLPLIQELQQYVGREGAGIFELAIFLADDELAIALGDGQSGDAFVQRNLVSFDQVRIFVLVGAEVNVYDFIVRGENRRQVGLLKSQVENVAIEAPVTAKDDKNALVGSGGGLKSLGDFLVSVDARGIEIFLFEGLAEASGSGVLGNGEKPLVTLMEPTLGHGDVLFLKGGAVFCGEGELEKEDVETGLRIILLDELRRKIGEAFGFPGRPESELVLEGDGLFAWADKMRLG